VQRQLQNIGDLDAAPANADASWDDACGKKFQAAYIPAVTNHWTWAAAYTLIPIPIVWLIVYGIVLLVRWIAAGFSLSREQRSERRT
jgi:hypothetical protein